MFDVWCFSKVEGRVFLNLDFNHFITWNSRRGVGFKPDTFLSMKDRKHTASFQMRLGKV